MRRFGLAHGLSQLTGRERFLVLMLFLVAVPVAIVMLVFLPLLDARQVARIEAAQARAELSWLAEQVRLTPETFDDTSQNTASDAVLGLSEIENRLVSAGLRDQVSQLANRADGGIDLALTSAPFDQLGTWLNEVIPDWGYKLAAFKIDADKPGLVHARFELVLP